MLSSNKYFGGVFLKLIVISLIILGLLSYFVRTQQKIAQFVRSNEILFFYIFIKKTKDPHDLKKIKKTILHTYAQSSSKTKVVYSIERLLCILGFLAGIIWFCIVIIFNLDKKLLLPTIVSLLIIIPIINFFPKQLYNFWKNQPIWNERPVNEQPFLLPTEEDSKKLDKYRLQSNSYLILILILVIYIVI